MHKKAVKYLGHIISKNQVTPLTDGLQAIREFPSPKDRKQMRQFLGKVLTITIITYLLPLLTSITTINLLKTVPCDSNHCIDY